MRDFLKYTLASLAGLVLFSILGSVGLVFLLVSLAATTKDAEPRVEKQTILTFDLSTPITDAPPTSDPSQVINDVLANSENRSVSLRTVLEGLAAAAEDDRIVGLYLHGSAITGGSGFANLGEVRQALEAFQKTGKPILAYESEFSEQNYYLASVADTIVLNPTGLVELNGFSSEAIFFADALEKFGIGVQPIRAGRYKSGVEPYTRSDRSPEERRQTQELLADLWDEFLSAVAASREVQTTELQAIADQRGILLAQEAEQAGLVDRLAHFDQVIPDLRKLTGETEKETSFRQIALSEYALASDQEANPFNRDQQIALIYAEGNIVSGSGNPGQIGGDRLARLFRDLRQNENVKAIVLRVNTPGGSASASERVTREVKLTSEVKPVIVSMGSLAASGGYQISAHADQIYATPTTITGSIGVFGLVPNVQELANNNGITWDVVKTAQFADMNGLSRPKTPEELAILQRVVDRIYDDFLALVAESRSLSKDRVAEIAQGRVWSGIQAKRIGLVDELGGLEDAIQAAAKQADLGDDWYVQEYPRSRSLEEQIVENLLNKYTQSSPVDPLTDQWRHLQAELESFQSFNDPQGIYTRLPTVPRIR